MIKKLFSHNPFGLWLNSNFEVNKLKKISICVFFLLAILVSLLAAGCSTPPASSSEATDNTENGLSVNLPIIANDYFSLLCTNTNVEISEYSYFRSVQYGFISSFPIQPEDLVLQFDKNIPFTYIIEMEEEPLPIDIVSFSTYQGISWVNMAQSLKDEHTTKPEELCQYEQALSGISADKKPGLYSGKLTITFGDTALISDVTLHRLDLIVKGKKYNYDIGSLRLLPSSFHISYSKGLMVDTLALTDINIIPSRDGLLYAEGIELSAQQDVTITKMYFNTEQISLDEVSYVYRMPDGNVVDAVWDMNSSININKETTITFNITASDDSLRDTLIGNRQVYLIFEYIFEGEQYTDYCELTYRMRQHPFHVYAFIEDRPNIIEYYTEYLPLLNVEVEQ